MPDLASALKAALTAQVLNKDIKNWHDEEEQRANPQATPAPAPTPAPASMERKKVVIVSLTEMVFNYIRDNPGVTNKQIGEWFHARGYKVSSTTSLAAQFVSAGMASRDAAGRITMLAQKYAPLRTSATAMTKDERRARKEDYRQRAAKRLATLAAKKQAAAQAAVDKRAAIQAAQGLNDIVTAPGIVALQPQATATPPVLSLAHLSPEQIIDSLSARQARDLYAALKEFFG